MKKQQLINQAIALYKNTLNPASKFYATDLANYSARVTLASIEQIIVSINNMTYAQSKKSDIDFELETRKLERGGMFNVANMKHINALD